jgi:hypothetical protein
MDPHDGEPIVLGVLLDDLVRDAHKRSPYVVPVEDELLGAHGSFLASRDRVKGAVSGP